MSSERYREFDLLGETYFGKFYRVRDALLDRPVRVVDLDFKHVRSKVERESLLRGAVSWARIPPHPNIVGLFDINADPFCVRLITSEFSMPTLREKLAKWKPDNEETVGIMVQLCRAIDHARQHEAKHGDLRPENIFLGRDGGSSCSDLKYHMFCAAPNPLPTSGL